MTLASRRQRTAFVLLLAAALVGSACGSSGDDAVDGSASGDGAAVRPASIEVAVPDLTVHDLQAGGEQPLRAVLGGEQPVLFWFWAPH